MTGRPGPRSRRERIADARRVLATEIDCWVVSADTRGRAHLVPLSHMWDGEHIVIATLVESRTMRDLTRAGVTRVGVGATRDVVMVDATVARVDADAIDPVMLERFVAVHDWDPRADPDGYAFLVLTPTRIQAWRDSAELAERTIMRDGRWLA